MGAWEDAVMSQLLRILCVVQAQHPVVVVEQLELMKSVPTMEKALRGLCGLDLRDLVV